MVDFDTSAATLSEGSERQYVTDDKFFAKNLHRDTVSEGVAILGYSLLPISRHDESITTVLITNTCAQCIELATHYDGGSTGSRMRFLRVVGFDTGDVEESGVKIGGDIAALPRAEVLELRDPSDVLENEFFVGMFEEISLSPTISKFIFRRCNFNRFVFDSVATLFCSRHVREVEFRDCVIESYLVDALADCDDYVSNWRLLLFDNCVFGRGVFTSLIRFQSAEMPGLVRLEYNDCVGTNNGWRRLFRDSAIWRHAELSSTDGNDGTETIQLELQRIATVRTGGSGARSGLSDA